MSEVLLFWIYMTATVRTCRAQNGHIYMSYIYIYNLARLQFQWHITNYLEDLVFYPCNCWGANCLLNYTNSWCIFGALSSKDETTKNTRRQFNRPWDCSLGVLYSQVSICFNEDHLRADQRSYVFAWLRTGTKGPTNWVTSILGNMICCLVVWNMFLFFHILGIILPFD